MDNVNGVVVYNYEGLQVSNPRFTGLRPEFLNRHTVALANDCVAILDRADNKMIKCFDAATGKALAGNIAHKTDIVQFALNQYETNIVDRRIAILDRNRDLFITPVVPQSGIFRGMYKLQTQVDTMMWNDTSDMLCAIADGRLFVWYYPNVVFVDRDLLPSTTSIKEMGEVFGQVPQLSAFSGNRASVRKADGALVYTAVSSYVPMLYRLVADA